MSGDIVRAPIVGRPFIETVHFLGVRIDLVTSHALIDLVHECIVSHQKTVVAHHNLHSLCLHSSTTQDAASLRRFYDMAHYTLADGMSMVVLGRLCGKRILRRHRVAYNDWLPVMLPTAVKREWRIFYLGSTPEVVAKAKGVLLARFPGLILEVFHGHFDARDGSAENALVRAKIAEFQPNILFVGMGAPRQERWIKENVEGIDADVFLSSGATLDYIAGAKLMAPRWMGRLGLEWAFRLATEPRRLAFRYLVEPWGLLSAVLTNRLPTSRDLAAPVRTEGSN